MDFFSTNHYKFNIIADEKGNNKTLILIILIVLLIGVSALIVYFILKKKKLKEEKNNENLGKTDVIADTQVIPQVNNEPIPQELPEVELVKKVKEDNKEEVK